MYTLLCLSSVTYPTDGIWKRENVCEENTEDDMRWDRTCKNYMDKSGECTCIRYGMRDVDTIWHRTQTPVAITLNIIFARTQWILFFHFYHQIYSLFLSFCFVLLLLLQILSKIFVLKILQTITHILDDTMTAKNSTWVQYTKAYMLYKL